MSDDRPKSASPFSTGGGGTRLEHRLGAVFLARLLTGRAVPELDERAPTSVAFQQSPASSVDDLIVTAPAPDGASSVRLDIAVRRTPKFIKSHKKTAELVATLLRADLAAERDSNPLVDHRLAVAVSGTQKHALEVAELAGVARNQASADAFVELVRTPGKFASRRRLDHLIELVKAAQDDLAESDSGTAEYRCWCLLRRLWIMQVDLEQGHERDWTSLVDDLKPFALGKSTEASTALRHRLEQLASDLAQSAGVVNSPTLRRRLHGKIVQDAHPRPLGWKRLVELDQRAQSTVQRAIVISKTNWLRLPRKSVRESIQNAILAPGDLLITGDSGVGKSALTMDAIRQDQLGTDRQAIALNLRDLPTGLLELLGYLQSAPCDLLNELTAPERLLVIDGTEAAVEGAHGSFSYLLRTAKDAGFKIVAIAASEAAGRVTQLMHASNCDPTELTVPGLDDEELEDVANRIPALRRFLDNARARELLRRPIVVELLGRAGDSGLAMSDAQALDIIWQHLVRNDGRRDHGAPGAREEAMLRLAKHALLGGSADELLGHLDHDAIAGLRHSGLLLPDSGLPWDRIPAFKHDLVRTYAVARQLLAERAPAAALKTAGAPRWTLPAARLACEIVLGAPDTHTFPVSGRFAGLQTAFESIVSSGHGERWADVPTEALLTIAEPADLLSDAWTLLVHNHGQGLQRLFRVLRGRHLRGGLLDSVVADPVIVRLLDAGSPPSVAEMAAELTRDWLRAHVFHRTPAGKTARIKLREEIIRRCAEKERRLDERAAALRAELTARTPEQIASEQESHSLRVACLGQGPPKHSRTRRNEPGRYRPYQWIDDQQIEHLALLGPDLGEEGERLLRRIAEDEPHSLDHAVEVPFGGSSLASYSPELLADLATAYYLEADDEGFDGVRDLNDGVRAHRYHGSYWPMVGFTNGPFLALFRADLQIGIAFINRMLEHAVRHRSRSLASFHAGSGAAEEDRSEVKRVLSIAGEPREYTGDNQVWLWYRGTGSGPYPCMSALQALESVLEEYIRAGVPPDVLATRVLAQAQSLAMPALALGILVRHLEDVGDAIDPYLVEPTVWDLEFSRALHDQTNGLASQVPNLPNPDRRAWNLCDVSAWLALRERDPVRAARLKDLGNDLYSNAQALASEWPQEGVEERLALVRNWARLLDRSSYDIQRQGDHLVVRQTADPDAERVLETTNRDIRRNNDAMGLLARHVYPRGDTGQAPGIDSGTLANDVVLAKDLLTDPPRSFSFSPDGPVAVAASAVELCFTGRADVRDDDLTWSADVLLQVAAQLRRSDRRGFDDSLFAQGADRSAARALPLLLLPAASDVRGVLFTDRIDGVDEFLELHRAVAVNGVSEARLAYARALDSVWAAPCDAQLGHCHHTIAFSLVVESFMDSVFGEWNAERQQCSMITLDPPTANSLDSVSGDKISMQRLTAGIRATGAAAISRACCADSASETLSSLVRAHQRSMLAHKYGPQHSRSESLVAARAALIQAIRGDDHELLAYVRRYLPNSRLLGECLGAISAAAEESAEAGGHARRLWPAIMDLVIDFGRDDPDVFSNRPWGEYSEAYLLPNPAAQWGYLTIELAGEPYQWRDLLFWTPQVERWLGAISNSRMSTEHLVIAIRDLDVADQVEQGLRWIERIVTASDKNCASTNTLPEWLRDRRTDLASDEQVARWQRIIDMLVVAGDGQVADLTD